MADEKLGTEIRREQIAQAALSLVAGEGPRKLSIAAVARRVGLVPSGIYRHFRNKDEMLTAVLDLIESRMMANVAAAREESDDPLECLKGVLTRHIRFIREGRAIPQMIFAGDLHDGHPERKQHILRILRRYAGEVAQIVRQGQQRGCVRRELNPETVAMMLFGIVVPAGILWHLTEGEFDVTRHAGRAWPILRAAIAAEPAGGAARL
jgi:AcrR family transcriptional regulator